MKVNMIGCTRIVFEFKNFVVKIPKFTHQWSHFLMGLISNMDESKTWKWNSGKYEKGTSYLLCPVLWCSWGGWILIMKKATMLTSEDWQTTFIPEHKKHFGGDDKLANYGYFNGKVVKVDYGQLDSFFGDDFKPQAAPIK
jgi:hypothetical protein